MPSAEPTMPPLSFYNTPDDELSKASPKSPGQLSNQSCKRYSEIPAFVPLAPQVVAQLYNISDNRQPIPSPSVALQVSIRPSSGAWTPSDDQTLKAARVRGMNWVPIQQSYFPSKTPNACRKRHERLMEWRAEGDWDGLKLENLAKNYMTMRREIWSALAEHTGEKWNVVEQKCMSLGIKNLQTDARSCARRERMLDPSDSTSSHGMTGAESHSHHSFKTGFKAHTDDSGYGDEDDAEGVLEEYHKDRDGLRTMGGTDIKKIERPAIGMGMPAIMIPPPSEANEKVSSIVPLISVDSQPSSPAKIGIQPNFLESTGLSGLPVSSSNTTSRALPAGIVTSSESQDKDNFQEEKPASDHNTGNDQTDPRLYVSSTSANAQEKLMLSLNGTLRSTLLSMTMKAILTDWNGRQFHHFRQCPKSTTAHSGPAEFPSPPPSLSNSSVATSADNAGKSPLKRRLQNSGDEDKQDGNGRKRPRKELDDVPREESSLQRLLCPFREHDHTLFRPKTGVDICGGTWPDIAKLKEHLYRRHYVEFQCQRCKVGFASKSKLCQHAESDVACEPRPRKAKDGFTSDIKLVLLSKKKSSPNQDKEDKWKEIYLLLFPLTDTAMSPFSQSKSSRDPENQPSQENITLEEFGSLELPEEFRRRAVSLIAEAVRPLQDQLAKQVSSIVHDSQEAINARYQQMIKTSSLFNATPMDDPAKPYRNQTAELESFPVVPELYMTTEHNYMEINDYQLTSACDNAFDLSLDSWTSLGQDEVPKLMYEASYSPLGFPSNLSCLCKCTPCICQPTKGSQLDTRESSKSSDDASGSLETGPNIMSLLQGMQRSIETLEKKLSAVQSNSWL
ncbi:hypothetical protein BKA61DRAFT_707599 [Leptodontidium sp. MPI-SDFR-AT-0119]|nr:hypothetical protein BKA61DRAFT_707599 [Leptodontidium sp. MPI-SDFR-AT-0119]